MAIARWTTILTVGAVACVVIAAAVLNFVSLTPHVVDIGRELAFPAKLLDAHVVTLAKSDGGVSVVSDGTVGRVRERGGRFWESNFDLRVNDEFYGLQHDGGGTQYRLVRIADDGIDVAFEALARPRDGTGSAPTIVDQGEIHLAWRRGVSRYALPPKPPAAK